MDPHEHGPVVTRTYTVQPAYCGSMVPISDHPWRPRACAARTRPTRLTAARFAALAHRVQRRDEEPTHAQGSASRPNVGHNDCNFFPSNWLMEAVFGP